MMDGPEQLRSRRVLVTGASGFIGSQLCRRLSALRAELHAVSRAARGPESGATWWQADLTDFDRVKQIVSTVRPELIYHLASHVTGSRDLSMVVPIMGANLVSAVHLMTAASEAGCRRIVLAGSLEEPRGDAAAPSSPYAAAKWAASGYARMFHSLYAMQLVSLRIAMAYGPGQADTSKLIPYVIRSLLQGEAPRLASGRREVDWVYVADVVDAMIACAGEVEEGYLSLDIGSGACVSIREIAERLCRTIAPTIRPVYGAMADRPFDQSWTADNSAAREKLNWQPRTPLDDGLRLTIDWYRELAADGVGDG